MTATAPVPNKKQKKTVTATFSAPIAEVHLVPIGLIDVQPQIRTEFDEESIAELAADIKARGLMQPVLLNPDTNGRFVMIAGERRLRAIKLNGQESIPALITKAGNEDAMLMQLAENVQREDLNLPDECAAIEKLYSALGSMKAVSEKVKKSIPWCSKRHNMANGLHWKAQNMFEEGISEDIELLKAFSDCMFMDYGKGVELAGQIRAKKIGRNEVRAALKELKAAAVKEKNEKMPGEVSHAKKKGAPPPPPPAWNLEKAINDIDEALNWAESEKTGLETLWSFSKEQQTEITDRLDKCAADGAKYDGLQTIANPVFNPYWETKISSIETMAMIVGYSGKKFDAPALIDMLQTKKK